MKRMTSVSNRCHPGSPAGAVRDPGDRANAVRFTWVPDSAARFRDDNLY